MPTPVKHYNTILPIPDTDKYKGSRPRTLKQLSPFFAARATILRNIDYKMFNSYPTKPSIEGLNAIRIRHPAPHPALANRRIELIPAEPNNQRSVYRSLLDEFKECDSIAPVITIDENPNQTSKRPRLNRSPSPSL